MFTTKLRRLLRLYFGCPNRIERGIEVFLVKLMVVESSIVVPIMLVMWDLKFIVDLVATELICVEKLR